MDRVLARRIRSENHKNFRDKNLFEHSSHGDRSLDVRKLLKLTSEGQWKGVEWIQIVQDVVQWRAPVETAINILVPQKKRNLIASGANVAFSRMAWQHFVVIVIVR